jgi:hypothetical protein
MQSLPPHGFLGVVHTKPVWTRFPVFSRLPGQISSLLVYPNIDTLSRWAAYNQCKILVILVSAINPCPCGYQPDVPLNSREDSPEAESSLCSEIDVETQ